MLNQTRTLISSLHALVPAHPKGAPPELGRNREMIGTLRTRPHGIVGAPILVMEVVHVEVILVAGIVLALLHPAEQPAHAAPKGLDKVPGVQCVPDGGEAEEASAGRVLGVFKIGLALGDVGTWVEAGFRAGAVLGVGEGPEVEDGEDGHLETEEEGGDSDLEVGVGEIFVGVDQIEGRGSEGNGDGLPKGQEDHKFNGQNFGEWLLLG